MKQCECGAILQDFLEYCESCGLECLDSKDLPRRTTYGSEDGRRDRVEFHIDEESRRRGYICWKCQKDFDEAPDNLILTGREALGSLLYRFKFRQDFSWHLQNVHGGSNKKAKLKKDGVRRVRAT